MTNSKRTEKILKALANHRRVEILMILRRKKDITVGEIAGAIHLSFKSTSRHLVVLAAAGIVEKEQINLEVYYELSSEMPVLARMIISSF